MAIHRVLARWSGFPGAPGYSSFHFSGFTGGADANQVRLRVRGFFNEVNYLFPGDVSVEIDNTVEVLDEATGVLQDYADDDQDMTITAAGSGNSYAGPSGAVVNWLTNTVNNGRRVRGRTFIVPIGANMYDSDGTLSSEALANLRDGADALLDGDFNSEFVVWSRPRNGAGGVAAPVTGYRVPDMAAVLRSRRD